MIDAHVVEGMQENDVRLVVVLDNIVVYYQCIYMRNPPLIHVPCIKC